MTPEYDPGFSIITELLTLETCYVTDATTSPLCCDFMCLFIDARGRCCAKNTLSLCSDLVKIFFMSVRVAACSHYLMCREGNPTLTILISIRIWGRGGGETGTPTRALNSTLIGMHKENVFDFMHMNFLCVRQVSDIHTGLCMVAVWFSVTLNRTDYVTVLVRFGCNLCILMNM